MNRIQKIFVPLLLALLILAGGCSDFESNTDSSVEAPANATADTGQRATQHEAITQPLSCTINGTGWNCDTAGGMVMENPQTGERTLMLTFEAGDQEALSLTFDLADDSLIAASLTTMMKTSQGDTRSFTVVYYNKSNSPNAGTGSGKLTDRSDDKVSGTFESTMKLARHDIQELDNTAAQEFIVRGSFDDVEFIDAHRGVK
ncbi:MAG: hypothetical protein ACR2NP_11920 [Pirellulaceae bacterium]